MTKIRTCQFVTKVNTRTNYELVRCTNKSKVITHKLFKLCPYHDEIIIKWNEAGRISDILDAIARIMKYNRLKKEEVKPNRNN